MNDHDDRIPQLESRLAALEQAFGAAQVLIEALMKGSAIRSERESAEAKLLGPVFALLATRVRACEEAQFGPERALEIHEYWCRGLAAIGVNPDPLKLE